jgi:hypothetical protein
MRTSAGTQGRGFVRLHGVALHDVDLRPWFAADVFDMMHIALITNEKEKSNFNEDMALDRGGAGSAGRNCAGEDGCGTGGG